MENLTTLNREKSGKKIALIIYALYALSFFTGGVTTLVGVIINYVQKDDVAGTFIESHFRWQIRTFWFGLLWGIIGAITLTFVVGGFILFTNAIWFIYRIIRGWLRLNENKPMYTKSSNINY